MRKWKIGEKKKEKRKKRWRWILLSSRERESVTPRERERERGSTQTRTNHREKERELTTKVISLIRFSTKIILVNPWLQLSRYRILQSLSLFFSFLSSDSHILGKSVYVFDCKMFGLTVCFFFFIWFYLRSVEARVLYLIQIYIILFFPVQSEPNFIWFW